MTKSVQSIALGIRARVRAQDLSAKNEAYLDRVLAEYAPQGPDIFHGLAFAIETIAAEYAQDARNIQADYEDEPASVIQADLDYAAEQQDIADALNELRDESEGWAEWFSEPGALVGRAA